jgi:hypothetical protein
MACKSFELHGTQLFFGNSETIQMHTHVNLQD